MKGLKATEGEFLIRDFPFRSGEVLPELRLHYATLGTARRDAKGKVRNAVLFLHHTGASGAKYLEEAFARPLYGRGQPLDAARWYVILPDSIGHGGSSKPSAGLRMRFPHYDYQDMVTAQYRLVREGLAVDHLRLVTGISMGGMHTWLWGEEYPDCMDALLPLTSLPVEIAGRNRMWRRAAMDAIRHDPAWNNGEYQSRPYGLVVAAEIFAIAVNGALALQRQAPTGEEADRVLEELARPKAEGDANDFLYALDASRSYNPEPRLGRIRARLLAINTADDFINPVDLGILERAIKRVKRGRYVLLRSTGKGHHTVQDPATWKKYLAQMLRASD